MIHLFKADPAGKWQTADGQSYNVVCVNDRSKHPTTDGWCKSLENALKSKVKKEPKVPADESGETSQASPV